MSKWIVVAYVKLLLWLHLCYICSYLWTINMVSVCLHKLLSTFCLQCLYCDEDDAHLCILGTKDMLSNCVKFLLGQSIRYQLCLFNGL